MTNQNIQRLKYIVGDYVGANIGWLLYIVIRYYITQDYEQMQRYDSLQSFMSVPAVISGQLFFPVLMVFAAYLSGYYNTVYFKSRLQELTTTLLSTFFVSIVMFFIILVNDSYPGRLANYELTLSMWVCISVFIYIFRAIIASSTSSKIKKGQLKFSTVVIGNNKASEEFIQKFCIDNNSGYDVACILRFEDEPRESEFGNIPVYDVGDIDRIYALHDVKMIIIVPYKRDKDDLFGLINNLFKFNIPIKISPELYDIITARVHHNNIFGEPLIDIAQSSMPEYQKCIKRVLDIAVSVVSLIILSPVFAVVALLIKSDSSGKVIYSQERIGWHCKPFDIYKFRTMCKDAEKSNIPQLSSEHDSRITRVGKVLRKYRIDEIPQFWNVLKGDMSLVGPRPERQYFINQIVKSAPYHIMIYQVRPGITSLATVKVGYTTDLGKMIERTKYDLIYIENMSILVDLKIIAYTIRTIVKGKGL